MNCLNLGGQELLDLVENDPFLSSHCEIKAKECRNRCNEGKDSPVVVINEVIYPKMTADALIELLHRQIKEQRD
jgi:NADH:ubiquinone oxidoreductase subunit E